MREEKPIDENEFKRRTESVVRLFLSVDLENSTRLKQSTGRFSEKWLANVLLFIRGFSQLFEAQLHERRRTQSAPELSVPPVWKVLGDELIFVTVVKLRFDVLTFVESFRESLRIWNEDVRSGSERGPLFVKGAAWLAGFPVVNAIFMAADGREDYTGPSIDAGFRIGRLATPRRLALSVDLAWLLLKCGLPGSIRFDGPTAMKGLAEEMGYPSLWLEVGESEYVKKEAQILGRGMQDSSGEMKALCASYIEEFGVPNYLPFLPDEPTLTPKPTSYEARLSEVKKFLRDNVYLVDEAREETPEPVRKQETRALLELVKRQEKGSH